MVIANAYTDKEQDDSTSESENDEAVGNDGNGTEVIETHGVFLVNA